MRAHYIGPTMLDFIGTCWEEQPVKMYCAIGSAAAFLVIASLVSLTHIWSLSEAPISLRRKLYMQIMFLPVVFAWTAILALLSPTSMTLVIMSHKVYEAYTLSRFANILWILLAKESSVLRPACSDRSKGDEAECIVRALAAKGRRKHFGTPPFGCLFRPFMHEFNLSIEHLRYIFWFARQYIIVAPACGVCSAFALTFFTIPTWTLVQKFLKSVAGVSNIVCLQALFILYSSTHDLLVEWNTTRKFVAIKLILVLLMYQDLLIEKFLTPVLERQDSCFEHLHLSHRRWADLETQFWGMWLLMLEMIPTSILLRSAYSTGDLYKVFPEVHHEILDLQLAQAHEAEHSDDQDMASSDD